MQRTQVRWWVKQGRRRVGAKIGLTSRAVQESFGVYQPDFGVLFADMAVADGAEVAIEAAASRGSRPRSPSSSARTCRASR